MKRVRSFPHAAARPTAPPGRRAAWLVALGPLLAGLLLAQAATTSAGTPDTIRLRTLSVVDREGTGGEAFRILIPEGWRFSGGIQWMPDNAGLPATADFQVSSPDGKAAFQVLPTQPFFWTDIQKILSEHPRGSRYYGRQVQPPMQPVDALKRTVIPRVRPDVRHLEVLEEHMLTGLASGLSAGILSQPDAEATASGGTVRIQYVRDGIQHDERFYCVVQQILFSFPSPAGARTTLMWNVGPIVSFRAEAGTFQDSDPILQSLAFSCRWNPDWFNRYCRLVAFMMINRLEKLESTEQMQRVLTHEVGEISDAIMGYYREHQQVYTRVAEAFASAGRRVEPYHNPLNREDVDLPSGFDRAWTNPQGEYVLSRNPVFKPDPGPDDLEWTRIRPIRAR